MKLGIFFLLSLLAQAPTVQEVTYSHTVTPNASIISEHWNVPLFDASLGTLTMVRLESDWQHGRLTCQESECSNAIDPLTVHYAMFAESIISRNTLGLLIGTDHPTIDLTTFGPYDGNTDFAGASGMSDRTAYSNVTIQDFTSPTDLATFVGTGNMDLILFMFGNASFTITNSTGCSSGYSTLLRQKLSGTFKVTYFYN